MLYYDNNQKCRELLESLKQRALKPKKLKFKNYFKQIEFEQDEINDLDKQNIRIKKEKD